MKNESLGTLSFSSLFKSLKNNVVIDCGHLPIKYKETIQFKEEADLESEILTLDLGIEVAKELFRLGKKPLCNICFSDVSKYIHGLNNRELIKKSLEMGTIEESLPSCYQDRLRHFRELGVPIVYCLQTANSNLATSLIKKCKKNLRSLCDQEKIYHHYRAHFVSDESQNSFGIVTPFVYSREKEDRAMGGNWWQESSLPLHPSDLVRAPLLKIKKMEVINLYSKQDGILCPGTYLGQLLRYDNHYDHIAIYSRNQDPDIGEKINRAAIAAFYLLPSYNRTCLHIVKPSQLAGVEVAEFSRNTFPEMDFAKFMDFFNNSSLNDTYVRFK